MIRGTTPIMELKIPGYDLRGCDIIVSIRNKAKNMNKTEADMDVAYEDGATTLTLLLTQEETLAFAWGNAEIQVNWLDGNQKRRATEIAKVFIAQNLYSKVMEHD